MDIILFIIFWALYFIGGIVAFSYRAYKERNDRVRHWESLANTKGLTFTPGSWSLFSFSKASVHGEYQDCNLVLEQIQEGEWDEWRDEWKDPPSLCTRLSVWPQERITVSVVPHPVPLGRKLAGHELKQLLSPQPQPVPTSHTEFSIFDIKARDNRPSLVYKEYWIATNDEVERLLNFLTELCHAYPKVLALGGDAVPALQGIALDKEELLRPVARQLLEAIMKDTTRRLRSEGERLFCPNCLTHCAAYHLKEVIFSNFYGCRTCHQSREFLRGSLIAILDNRMETEELIKEDRRLQVNWSRRGTLFDFDSVEIIHATDEEVERFVVQVGNDLDRRRRPRYSQMSCTVSAQCPLSENTVQILKRVFGEVKVEVLSGEVATSPA